MTDVLWQWFADVTVAVFERRMRQRNPDSRVLGIDIAGVSD